MKHQDFTPDYFKLAILLGCNKTDAFGYIATSKGLESWFLGKVLFQCDRVRKENEVCKTDDNFVWQWQKDYQISGKVIKCYEPGSVTYTFGDPFNVEFNLSEEDEFFTKLELVQHNLFPSENYSFGYINCCVCWTFFLTNLKSVIENRIDLREIKTFDESFINQ